MPQIRFPFPLGKGLGVRFFASFASSGYTRELNADPYCVITIAAVRLSGIVTDETRFVSGGKL